MNLSEATSKATATAEKLCLEMRDAAKLANIADPLFGEIFDGYSREVINLKNRIVLLDGAAKRRNNKLK